MAESPSSVSILEGLPKSDNKISALIGSLSRKFSIAVILIGTVGILGWIFDIPALKSIFPGLPSMKVNTATCFILSGSSLWLWHQHSRRQNLKFKVIRFLIFNFAFLIILIASLTLIEYGFNLNFGIDQLLMQQSEPASSLAVPGRMAPNTAFTFLAVGSALLLMSNSCSRAEVIQGLAIIAWLISFIGILGHVYGSVYFYTAGSYTGMAIHTAIAFQLFSLGILFASPDRGLMSLLMANSVGSLMLRQLLPLAIALPVFVNGLSSLGYHFDLYGQEIATALSSTLEILVFAGLAGWNARSLNQIDLKRREASDRLQQYANDIEDLYNNAPCGYHSLNANGTIVRINNTELDWLGYSREELLNQRKFTELLTPASLQIFQENFPKFKQQGYVNNLEFELVRKDDSTLWVSLNGTAIRDRAGNYIMSRSTLFDISERKQTEASMAQLAAIVEYSGDAIISKTLDGTILSWNKSAEKIFGYQLTEMIGQPLTRIIPVELLDEEQHILQAVWQGKTINQYETIRLCKDGKRIDISVTVAPLKDSTGRITGASATNRDISDRKRAEAALRQSEARFQAFMNHSPAASWITDENGILLYVSQTYARTFQLPASDLIDKSIFELYSTEVAQRFLDNIQTVAQTLQVLEVVEVAPRLNGTMGAFQVYKFPIPDASGQTLVGGVAIDITQQHEAEIALQKSEERLQMALEASGDGLWDWNISTGEVYYSPQYMKMLGYEVGELPNNLETWEYLTHPDDKPWVLDILNVHLRDSSVSYSFDYRIRTKSGDWKWVADYGKVVVRDKKGEPLRMIGTHRDVNDRKRAEERIATSLKEKEVLLKEIHHRVKNNLGIVSGLLQMQVRRAQSAGARAILQDSQNRITSISLVHEKLYRSENFANIDFSQYLQDLTLYLFDSYHVGSNQITLDIQVESVSLEIETAIPCGLIVNELVSNALKHAFPGDMTGKIQVRLAPSDTTGVNKQFPCLFTLAVRDNGIGIPNDFDPKSTQTLGMSLVQGLVAQIRGTIEINGQHGTEIKVTFRGSGV